ncbi:hypothetical protein CEE37_14170 [candidate division LCP-89 bacterium B3_LCP]|uniref:Peptidase M14 domain-containing protein n=1 Tax=candidate division LCP-89 bacterium B3_LCP TaxID=2012998 RepID=A0A532UQN7_UNCL8|nr:MAG: hypothetical protein CEE37_14170 [candidate division LCP-89 bacterium B3_LCP]
MKTTKLLLITICAIMVSISAFADDTGYYQVPVGARDVLVAMKTTVHHGRFEGDFIAELSLDEIEVLRNNGFEVKPVSDNYLLDELGIGHKPGTDDWHTYQEMRDGFYDLAANYPDITLLEVLGYSVQNRELFALKISANPLIEEDEPEVVFWGGIHGNEFTAAEVPYLHALYLCHNYGTNPAITEYIDNNEIWCIPMINPDGHELGTRNNANGIDLNRDYGYQWDGWGSSWYPFSQVESRVVREFCMENNITLSTTVHCSGDVLFYQWGFSPNTAPDNNLIVRVGERYSDAASYALVNSWSDYETHGEVLDYVYGSHGALCYTVETNNWSSQVQYTYERNQAGMNNFCELAGEGLHGMVTDAQSGDPLWAAVWIEGNPIPAYTDPSLGDFHRMMLPGTYDLTVWANGYQPETVTGVVVEFGVPGEFDVELTPSGGEYAFMVTSVNQEDPNNAYNTITYPAWALGAPDDLPCSIGSGGFIVLDMGEGHEIVDGNGNDFTVTEWDHPRDPGPETYRVYSGDAYNQNTLIGEATGTASFDLSTAGVTSTRYLKITDASGSSPNFPLAGMDLDAITVINSGIAVAGGIVAEVSIPAEVEISVYPNPFNPTTVLRFKLQDASLVSLNVYDIPGRLVTELVNGWRDAGVHEVAFDGSNIASGIYLYKLEAGEFTASGQMVLMK